MWSFRFVSFISPQCFLAFFSFPETIYIFVLLNGHFCDLVVSYFSSTPMYIPVFFRFAANNLYFLTFKNGHLCDHFVSSISFIPMFIRAFFSFPPDNLYFLIFKWSLLLSFCLVISVSPKYILAFFSFPSNNLYFRTFKNGHFGDHFDL